MATKNILCESQNCITQTTAIEIFYSRFLFIHLLLFLLLLWFLWVSFHTRVCCSLKCLYPLKIMLSNPLSVSAHAR